MLPLFCAFIGLSAAPLSAQLTVNQLEITVAPSATARVMATFVVHNGGKDAAQAVLTREDWSRAENGENQFVASGSTRNSCGALMNVFPTAFRIEPGAHQTIRLAVEKAPDMSKECWDIVFVEEVTQKRTQTRSGLQYIFRTGVKVYVTPKELKRDASITDMALENIATRLPSLTRIAKSPAATQRMAIRFSNSGQVHLAARGVIEIRRMDNSIVVEIPIVEFPTLPGAVRKLEIDVPPTIPAGSYIALALLDFGGKEIAAGQLELTVR